MIEQTKEEEKMNALIHLVTAFVMLILGFILIFYNGWNAKVISLALWSFGSVLVFLASFFYHKEEDPIRKNNLRQLDYSMIYIFLGLSVSTVFHFSQIKIDFGFYVFIWATIVIGVFIRFWKRGRFKSFHMFLYFLLGFSPFLLGRGFLEGFSNGVLLTLLLSGFFYTTGAFFLRLNFNYQHSFWHLFVSLGTVLIWLSVFQLI